MKSNLIPSVKKHTYPMHLFVDAVAYRISFPVTKTIAIASTIYPICPRCGISLEREYVSFCDRCGQKLNWDFFEYARVTRPDCRKNDFL